MDGSMNMYTLEFSHILGHKNLILVLFDDVAIHIYMCVNSHDIPQTKLSIKLPFGEYVTGCHYKNGTHFQKLDKEFIPKPFF